MNNEPSDKVDNNDRGDETLNRFKFQLIFAAVTTLALFPSKQSEYDVLEVYCEQFEDILIRLSNNQFLGVQVKSRDISLGPFKANNEDIIKSIRRFINLERLFPENFNNYVIVSNNAFYKKKGVSTALPYLVDLAKSNPNELVKKKSPPKRWIKKVIGNSDIKEIEIISILKKLHLREEFCSLLQMDDFLNNRIQELTEFKPKTLGIINCFAKLLISTCLDASSLSLNNSSLSYIHLCLGAEKVKDQLIIQSKKIDYERIKAIVESLGKENEISLYQQSPDELPFKPTTKKIDVKLDAGKVTSSNITLIKDHKYATENFSIRGLHKRNTRRVKDEYNQVKKIIHQICQEVYDEVYSENDDFGMKMLIETRRRIKERLIADSSMFFGYSYEHLLGMMGILTEDCRIWWSKEFSLDS